MTLSADVVWEVQTGGDDDNGGGFNSSSSGTDYSQQTTAQLTVTDAATSAAGSTTLTSATGGFTSAMVGNVVHLYGGTNLTDGWYEITGYTDTNTVTLDRAPDDGAGGVSGATCKVGGALGSPGGLGAALANAAQAGQKAWIKSGTYTLATSTTNTSGGPLDLPSSRALVVEGYGTTRGDGTRPVINAGSISSVTVVNLRGSYNKKGQYVRCIEVDGNNQTSIIGFNNSGTSYSMAECHDCVARRCSTYGFSINTIRCIADSCNVGFITEYALESVAKNCTSDGFKQGGTTLCVFGHCLSYGNGGRGFNFSTTYRLLSFNCTAYGNGSDGFSMTQYGMGHNFNHLSVGNGGYGFNQVGYDESLWNCCAYNNTSGDYDLSDWAVFDWKTITGDPFVDAANGDFRLNATPGAGAVLRGAGIGVYGQTDNQDVGAVQHSDPSSGNTNLIVPRTKLQLRGYSIVKRQHPIITNAGGTTTEYVPIPVSLRRLVIQQHYRRRPCAVISPAVPNSTTVVPVRSRAKTRTQLVSGRTRA